MSVTQINDLKQRQQESLAAARRISQRAADENRRLNDNETQQINGHMDEHDGYANEVRTLERTLNIEPTLSRQVEMVEVETVPDDVPQSVVEDAVEGEQYAARWDGGERVDPLRDMSVREAQAVVNAAGSRAYNDAFYRLMRGRGFTGQHVQQVERVRTMVEGVDADGGFLAPTQLVAGINREALVYEQLKPRMDVIRTNARSLTYTNGLDSIVMGWVLELGTKPEDQLSFGRTVLVPHVGAVVVWVSDELLEDEQFGLQGYIQQHVAEAKVLLEEEAFISGSGSGRPFGILTRLNAEGGTPNRQTLSLAAGGLDGAGLSNTVYSMPYRYRRNASWVMGTNAIRAVRLLRENGATGNFIWQPGLQAGEPQTILGYPVVESDAAALNGTITAGNDVAIFGDLRRYRVMERVTLQVKRLEELRALTDEVGFRFRFRTGGDTVLNKAFRTVRIAA